MQKQKIQDWLTEGKEKYGESFTDWEFVCPKCGRTNKVSEFMELGQIEGEAANNAYSECIGRYTDTKGCDWAAFGLLKTLGKGREIEAEDGAITNVFDFSK